jgi:hypothetical protein
LSATSRTTATIICVTQELLDTVLEADDTSPGAQPGWDRLSACVQLDVVGWCCG